MKRVPNRQSEKGVAIIVTLLALLVLSTLAASVAFMTQTEIWNSVNYTMLTQARYASEAGLQQTLNWMIYNYTPPASMASFDTAQSPVQYNMAPVVLSATSGIAGNYPDTTVRAAFRAALEAQPVAGMGTPARYSVSATLLSMKLVTQIDGTTAPVQVWRVASVGSLSTARQAEVELVAIMETPTLPALNFAAFATDVVCNSMDVGGGSRTDSFDSSIGSYATTQALSGGDVGSNGNINLNGTSTLVNGNVATPLAGTGNCSAPITALTISGGASISDSLVKLSEPLTFRTPPAPNPLPPTDSQSVSGNNNLCGTGANIISGCSESGPNDVTFTPGLYGNVSINGNNLHMNAGTYTFNSVSLGGGAQLFVDSAPIVIKLAGQSLGGAQPKVWDMAGGAVITNPLSRPKDLVVVYGGTAQINLSGGATTFAVVYAPTAPISASNSNWYGALIGKRISLSGGIQIHYDRSLINDFYTVGSFRPISFSWSKY